MVPAQNDRTGEFRAGILVQIFLARVQTFFILIQHCLLLRRKRIAKEVRIAEGKD